MHLESQPAFAHGNRPPAQLALRDATADDESLLRLLFIECQSERFVPLAASGCIVDGLIAMQYRARTQEYALRFPEAENRILLSPDGNSAGRLLLHREARSWRIVDLAVLSRYRGQGIATCCMHKLQMECEQAGVPLTLSVLHGSPAVRLYRRLGFQSTLGGNAVLLEMVYAGAEIRRFV